mgnify:CR=1 FL=1
MHFRLPQYIEPDFSRPHLTSAPLARFEAVTTDGVAPDNFHATSIFPEYFQCQPGTWVLPSRSRMDCVVVKRDKDHLEVVEPRRLKAGDLVAVGREENGEDGIYVHTECFLQPGSEKEKFAFRTRLTRETSFSIDYDTLYELLRYEREHGFILWVGGPAVIFDSDARQAFTQLIEQGYVHGLLAGNALAAHDLEGALYQTALGQGIYSKQSMRLGHYHHLDAINTIRRQGSIEAAIDQGLVPDGVMRALIHKDIPYVLAGSIRDDGPLPEVIPNVYAGQDAMRDLTSRATTVITMATQLHSIAVGNMTPSYATDDHHAVRPVYFFCVDISEFAADKLANRGSLSVSAILTNVQDFVVTLSRALA